MSIGGTKRRPRTGVAIIIMALLSHGAIEANAADAWKKVVKADPEIIGYGLGMVAATSARCGRYVILGGDIGETLDLFAELGVESVYLDGFNRGVAAIDRETFERTCDRDGLHRMVWGLYDFHPKFKEIVLCQKAQSEYGICPPAVPLATNRR